MLYFRDARRVDPATLYDELQSGRRIGLGQDEVSRREYQRRVFQSGQDAPAPRPTRSLRPCRRRPT